jgi:flagellar assembly factor FliW
MPSTLMTSLFGEIEYNKEEVYHFSQGIPGLPEQREFLLITIEDSLFTVMHSLTDDLYFFLIDPFDMFPDYEFTLPEYAIKQLEIERREDVMCYSIVVIREPFSASTTNLVAPVIFNTANRKAAQLVLENVPYSIRQPLFPEENAGEEAAVGRDTDESGR